MTSRIVAAHGNPPKLGRIGKEIARQELERHGFKVEAQHPPTDGFAHFRAWRFGESFWINVRTANKYNANSEQNPYLSLTPEEQSGAKHLSHKAPDSTAACMIVSVVASNTSALDGEPANSYSCYFLRYEQLRRQAVDMGDVHFRRYECWAYNQLVGEDISDCDNRTLS